MTCASLWVAFDGVRKTEGKRGKYRWRKSLRFPQPNGGITLQPRISVGSGGRVMTDLGGFKGVNLT